MALPGIWHNGTTWQIERCLIKL